METIVYDNSWPLAAVRVATPSWASLAGTTEWRAYLRSGGINKPCPRTRWWRPPFDRKGWNSPLHAIRLLDNTNNRPAADHVRPTTSPTLFFYILLPLLSCCRPVGTGFGLIERKKILDRPWLWDFKTGVELFESWLVIGVNRLLEMGQRFGKREAGNLCGKLFLTIDICGVKCVSLIFVINYF